MISQERGPDGGKEKRREEKRIEEKRREERRKG